MRKGETEAQSPRQAADRTSQPSSGAYCVQRAAGLAGSVCSHRSSPSSPSPVPPPDLSHDGGGSGRNGQGEKKKSWAEPMPPHSPPPPLRSHADPCGSGPQNPGVRGRGRVPPSGPQLGGGTWKAGKTTAQPAPRQPLPPLRPLAQRAEATPLYNRGRAGWLFHLGTREPSGPEPSAESPPPGPLPQLGKLRPPERAGARPAVPTPSPPTHPQQPGQARPKPASVLAVRTALPAPAAILPRPRRRGQSPRPPAPASAQRLGACLSGGPHPPSTPGGPLPPRPGELWGQISWQAGTAPRSGAERSEEAGGARRGRAGPPPT